MHFVRVVAHRRVAKIIRQKNFEEKLRAAFWKLRVKLLASGWIQRDQTRRSHEASPRNRKQECRMPTSKAMKKPASNVILMPIAMPTAPMPSAAKTATIIPMPMKPVPAKHAVKKKAAKKARKIVAKKVNARKKATMKKFAAAAAKKPARKSAPRLKK
jgi:hypothetical protein